MQATLHSFNQHIKFTTEGEANGGVPVLGKFFCNISLATVLSLMLFFQLFLQPAQFPCVEDCRYVKLF